MIDIILVSLIGFIIWWFFIAKPEVSTKHTSKIRVADGVYQPALFKFQFGKPVALTFYREDESPCAEVVTFPQLNISANLPLREAYVIELEFPQTGEYDFTCQMGMYRGKIIIY